MFLGSHLALPRALALRCSRALHFLSSPRPTLLPAEVARLAAGRSRRDPLRGVFVGSRLSRGDQELLAKARRRGALELPPGGAGRDAAALANAYYRHCFAQGRPYIALDRTGLAVTLEPCVMCAGAIREAGIDTVVFGARDERAGAGGSRYDVLGDDRLGPSPQVRSGVLEEQCAELLREFFALRRG